MARKILYDVFFVLCAAAAVLFLVLCILSFIPAENRSGLNVREKFDVSSSLIDKTSGKYEHQIRGSLFNPGEGSVTVDKLEFVVGNDKKSETVTLEGFIIYGRSEREILWKWQGGESYDRLESVTVYCGETASVLANNTADDAFNFGAIFCAMATVLFGVMAFSFGKQRYYLLQEDRMAAAKTPDQE